MFKGEICKFYELAKGTTEADPDPQKTCLDNYDSDPDKFKSGSGFRYDAFMLSLIAPICFSVLELCLNQLLLSWK